MSVRSKFICGVPSHECSGAPSMVNKSLPTDTKTHGSSLEAFRCYKQWLLRQGYTPVGNREFAAPNGGPVVVLTKKCRFGGRVRLGKGAGTGTAKRWVPRVPGHEAKGGLIVC